MVPDSILHAIDTLLRGTPSHRPVIAVTGPVAGGKTTLAHGIAGRYRSAAITTDDYFPDYAKVERASRDEPDVADLARLAADTASLRSGRATRVPVWSFFENRRVDERVVEPGAVVVVEGLFALHPILRDLIDLGIFVDAPRDARRERFVARSANGERGFTVEEADAHFAEIAEPTFWRHAPSYLLQAGARLEHDDLGGFRPTVEGVR
jgi:uridine kinase